MTEPAPPGFTGRKGKLREAGDLLKVTQAVGGGGPVGTWGVSSNILRKVTGHRVTAGTTLQTPFLELCSSLCAAAWWVAGWAGAGGREP